MLQILSFAFYSVIFLLVSWHEERWTFFSSMCESTFWFLQMVFKWRRLKEISVYHQHTVGVRGHALLWSGLCVRYGKVYNKCTMLRLFHWFYNKKRTKRPSNWTIFKIWLWSIVPHEPFAPYLVIAIPVNFLEGIFGYTSRLALHWYQICVVPFLGSKNRPISWTILYEFYGRDM